MVISKGYSKKLRKIQVRCQFGHHDSHMKSPNQSYAIRIQPSAP
jgi:hypothetical protein